MDWDKAVLHSVRSHEKNDFEPWANLHTCITRAVERKFREDKQPDDLSDPRVYEAHAQMIMWIANKMVLAPQRREFIVDDNNSDVLRFLLYYFNDCPLAESVFPGRGYKNHKNLLIQGGVGAGKTLLMQIFSVYSRMIESPRQFFNLSVTQMVNYYTIHNNLDRYTYFEEGGRGFDGKPVNVCLNDIGIQDKTFFGMSTALVTDEFLHARNEIWTQFGKFAHLTTNLTNEQLTERFTKGDTFGRLVDRFKTFNVIPLPGESRR